METPRKLHRGKTISTTKAQSGHPGDLRVLEQGPSRVPNHLRNCTPKVLLQPESSPALNPRRSTGKIKNHLDRNLPQKRNAPETNIAGSNHVRSHLPTDRSGKSGTTMPIAREATDVGTNHTRSGPTANGSPDRWTVPGCHRPSVSPGSVAHENKLLLLQK